MWCKLVSKPLILNELMLRERTSGCNWKSMSQVNSVGFLDFRFVAFVLYFVVVDELLVSVQRSA